MSLVLGEVGRSANVVLESGVLPGVVEMLWVTVVDLFNTEDDLSIVTTL